jgi:hypothetical protein
MNNPIEKYCYNTESIYGILNIFRDDFLNNYKLITSRRKKPVRTAMPYCYRMWYYSTLMADSPLSPANFINLQVQKDFGEETMIVPIALPKYRNKALIGFDFNYQPFSIDNHPLLRDLQLFLERCDPDIGVDELGLLLGEERETLLPEMCFKETFYITFLTNISYELGLLKKMPSIGIYRASPSIRNIKTFFKKSNEEQLRTIVAAVIEIASKQICKTFIHQKMFFSASALRSLFKDGCSLNDYMKDIFHKFGLDGEITDMHDHLSEDDEDFDEMELPKEVLMALALRMELGFLIDAYLTAPLGYYLQLIQPIYTELYEFDTYFNQIIELNTSQVPLIKLYFIMPNSYDITPLGKLILLNGDPAKHSYQKLSENTDFAVSYQEILNYDKPSTSLDMENIMQEFFSFFENSPKG